MQSVTTDLHAKWCAFKARVQVTWFWRVFGVCAMRKLWTKFLVAVAIAGCYLTAMFGLYLLNPVVPTLDQLNRTEGVLVHVYQPLRNAHGAKVRVRTDFGDEITFRGSMFDDAKAQLLAAKGKRVTVRSMPFYEAWPPFYYEHYWQIQEGQQVLLSYEPSRKRWLDGRERDAKLLKFSLALVILPIFIVVLACRRRTSAG